MVKKKTKSKYKFKPNRLIWVIAFFFIMSILPGEGTKAAGDQQAITQSIYVCEQDTDCPTCVGAGFADIDLEKIEAGEFHLGELSFSECNTEVGLCDLSEYCLVWDCGPTQQGCDSIKQTILDNTIVRFQENPILLLGAIGLVVAFIFL